jgi:hypothetical protein
MISVCTVSDAISIELRDTAAIQTELGGAKLTAVDDWHLLTKSLLDLKHRALDASSKLIAVHNGSTEVRPDVYEDAKLIGVIRRGRRPDVSIFRMAVDDWHLLTKSLLDLKHRALDASSKLMCWDRVISQRAVFNPLIYCL